MSHRRGKSDRGVVPKKLPNKAAGEVPAAAEVVEGRLRAKDNALAARMSRRTSRVYDVGTALDGIRQTAGGRRGARFDNLLHHIYAVERISALLANIYLHYAFDLWVKQWRGRHARGDVIAVRYFDDWVAGFQFRDDAERFQRAVAERLSQFGLKLYPDKTRLIEFGRFARENQRRQGQGEPQTFDFLGFTHWCGKTSQGKFMVLRLTSAKRLRVKLQAVKLELRRRMHQPIAQQGRYLRAVVTGHGRYFGVPCNGARLRTFRFQVARLWQRTLCRRSQSRGLTWRRMHRLTAHWLPVPNICHPYPSQRLIVTTQGRSRVR